MADTALCAASKLAEYLVAPVGRHCGYLIFPDSYVRQLNDEVENLGEAKDEVQHSIDEAQNNMKPIKSKVEKWVKEVEIIANKACDVLDYDRRAKKTCLYGWLPNPKARYHLGKEAKRAVKDIQALIARGQFEKVDCENPPPGLVGGAPNGNLSAGDGGNTITDSRASIFQGIMKALDDEKLKVIGVYGPGGVGKTTLLEEVEKKLRKEGRPFHMIVKAKVSQAQDLKKIQDDIAYAFSLNLKDESSEEGRRDRLFRKIQSDPTKKILIILDDLWEELDLKAVGIPSRDECGRGKLLLTSRFENVLEQKMCADKTFRLEGLNNDEAFRLFEKTVGDRLKDDEELKAIAAQVVKKLAGLPLLIISIAKTLKNSSVSAWNNALIKIDVSKMETLVKLSYNHLESDDAKYLFLLCGLIGGTIQVETLLVLGMGLGLFEEFNKTMPDLRDRLNTTLDELRSACLLLDGANDRDNVTIHDLYSEVVVSTPFNGQNSLMMNSNYGSWPKEKLEKCWAICLGSDRLAELIPCQFPDLKILMLSRAHDMGDCNRLDFTYMKELRVLYLRSMHILSLPSSIKIPENLQSLYLDNCLVEDVAILGKLKALQILSFAGSEISRLPKEIGELTKLKSLNLNNCSMLKIIEHGVLKGLINLEELHMKESFDRWMDEDEIPLESCNARLAELKSLTKLSALEISIPDPTILLEDGDLPFGNLIRFWIYIGKFYSRREFEGLRTMKLKLEGCDSILSKEWVQKTLQKTQYFRLDGLRVFKKNAYELCIRGFPQLKHLDIQNSPSIKYIASSSDGLPLTSFTILESLSLKNLINLEKICHGLVVLECFSKLKAVSVTKCDRLKYLWHLSHMQRLVLLEEIEIRECDSMQAIVTDDARKDIVATDNRVELPNVRRLELAKLPNMMSFCTGITLEGAPIQVSFPCLESLVMVGLLLDLEKILYSQPPLPYSNLKSIEIRKSKSMARILKSDWILKLPNLESLKIESSPSTKVVFDLEELKVIGHVKILSRLMELTLRELPNLQRMWKQDGQLQGMSIFQNLKGLLVNNTGLTFLFPVSVAKCLREIRDIQVMDCPNMKAVIVDEEGRDEGTDDIIEFPLLKRLCISGCPTEKFFSYSSWKDMSITTTSNSQDAYSDSFFNQKVSLPSLEELELESIGSLKRIWHGELPRSSFCELTNLALRKCSHLLNVFPSAIIKRLHNLEKITVFKCPSLESLFDCGSLDSNTEDKIVSLPKLEVVWVRGTRRLRHMVKSDSQTVLGFPNLKSVEVKICSELRDLFPNYTATTLEKLESLWISECEQMKEVVPKEEGGQSKADVMSFPCLIKLRLDKLNNLICFSSGSCSYGFASLEELSITGCPNFGAFIPSPTSVERPLGKMAEGDDESPQKLFNEMVTFPNITTLVIKGAKCKELWNSEIPNNSFCKLKYLQLEHCDHLLCIAPSHMWKTLQRCLHILVVRYCYSIEIIYRTDGTVTKGSKLRTLFLCDLDNLRHIWQFDGLPNVPFPNLRYVEAVRCSRLEMLFATFTPKFLGQIEELVVESCKDMELIAGHEVCEEATSTAIIFSGSTVLRIFELPKLKSFLPETYSAEFPSLQILSRVSCGTEPDQCLGDWKSESHKRYIRRYVDK